VRSYAQTKAIRTKSKKLTGWKKEKAEHPWLTKTQAIRVNRDHHKKGRKARR
jgi:hypothetical protein